MKERKLSNGMGSFRIDTQVGEKLAKALSKKFVTRVGILGQKNERQEGNNSSGKTNAEIGLKHENGSLSERIPKRSFLKVPLTQNIGKIDVAGKTIKANMDAIDKGMNPEAAFKKAHRDLGIIGEQIVQKAFEESGPGWPPNSPVTIELKGSDKPLIDTGQLRRSIMSDVQERSKA